MILLNFPHPRALERLRGIGQAGLSAPAAPDGEH